MFPACASAASRGFLLGATLAIVVVAGSRASAQDTAPRYDTAAVYTAANVRYDTSTIAVRMPDERELERYRSDARFQYGREFRQPESLGERIRRWIADLWKSLFDTESETTFWRILTWAILIGSFIYVALKLIGVNVGGLILGERRGSGSASALAGGEIGSTDFAAAVAVAESAGNLREATRLQYLWTLQELGDRKAIVWRADKTDLEYARELADTPLRIPFERAALLFDFVWYGGFPLNAATYRWVRDSIAAVRVNP